MCRHAKIESHLNGRVNNNGQKSTLKSCGSSSCCTGRDDGAGSVMAIDVAKKIIVPCLVLILIFLFRIQLVLRLEYQPCLQVDEIWWYLFYAQCFSSRNYFRHLQDVFRATSCPYTLLQNLISSIF